MFFIIDLFKKLFSIARYVIYSYFHDYRLHPLSKYYGNNSFGSNCRIYRSVLLNNVIIGNYSYVNTFTEISNTKIGAFCSIGSRAKIGGFGAHKMGISTHPSFYDPLPPTKSFGTDNSFNPYKKVKIGNDVWVGDGSIILDGVEVGDGAIIAAGSVVHKNVPPFAIVGGNPIQLIRYRFLEEDITKLVKSKWWDLHEEELNKLAPLMSNDKNISEIFKK